MARFFGVAATAEIALAAATAKTVLQIVAATNHRVVIKRVGFFFDGVSVTGAPVQITLSRQSTAGTGGDSLTPTKLDDSIADTLLTTAQKDIDGGEPTTGDLLDAWECHPQQGMEIIYPLGEEPIVGGGDRVGLICTADAIVNVRAKIVFEE